MSLAKQFIVTIVCFLSLLSTVAAEKFLPGDPHWKDPDRVQTRKPPELEISRIHDFLEQTFVDSPQKQNIRAVNINTLGEVPDSSWFTNRIGIRPMSVQQVARGPNRSEGPDISRDWIVTEAKSEGVTPGFVIEDARGDTYFIKLDTPKYPELQSTAEIIGTKIFHAIGYHVPQNYLVYFKRAQLRVKPGGVKEKDIDLLLKKAASRSDGTIRAIASLRLKGEPLGGFLFEGTRSDDPNDIFPHEHRRELRGYRVFSSWLNHRDSDSVNTLDMFVKESGNSYVKHHLLDFGTTLGSGGVGPQSRRAGYEHRFELAPILRSAATLGIWEREWRYIDYPDYPSVGRFEAEHFEPQKWKPDHPNPAFTNMRNDDAFWAARIVSRFSDEMMNGIVKTAEMTDKNAERYLLQTLLKRRDKIVRYYFSQVNPLSEFSLQNGILRFQNLGEIYGVGSVKNYVYEWHRFDNRTGRTDPIAGSKVTGNPVIRVPDAGSEFLLVKIRSISSDQPNWNKMVEVYIKNNPEKSTIVGIEREN